MALSINFRPTPEDERILRETALPGESASDTLRRALRLLGHEAWLDRFHSDARRIMGEGINAQPEAW